jgi:hypothetical protein
MGGSHKSSRASEENAGATHQALRDVFGRRSRVESEESDGDNDDEERRSLYPSRFFKVNGFQGISMGLGAFMQISLFANGRSRPDPDKS